MFGARFIIQNYKRKPPAAISRCGGYYSVHSFLLKKRTAEVKNKIPVSSRSFRLAYKTCGRVSQENSVVRPQVTNACGRIVL